MGSNHYNVVQTHERRAARPIQIGKLLFGQFRQDLLLICFYFKRTFPCNYQVVFSLIHADIVFFLCLDIFEEILRILLKEKYIGFDISQTLDELRELLLLIEKTQLVERLHYLQVFCWTQIDRIINFLHFVDIPEKGMICNDVVEFQIVLFLSFHIYLHFDSHLPEYFLPLLLKSSPTHELIIINTNRKSKHGRVPANPKLNVQFAELPLELVFIEGCEVSRQQFNEDGTEFLQHQCKPLTVELERTIHNPTVVESSHCQMVFNIQILS